MSLRENNQTVQDYIRALEDRIRALELGNRINARSWLMQENSEGDFVFRHMDGRTITLGTSGTDIVLSGGAGGSLILGESAVTAYRGDRGKVAYDHSQIVIGNPHGTTKADVGLGLVPNVNLATAVASNSAKVTNATHTGDATGSGALSVVGLRGVGLDSSVSTPVDGDTLVYRSAGSDWVLEAKPTGGSGMTVVADQTARDAIPTPSVGLQVFRGDTKAIEVYNGTTWRSFDTEWQTYAADVYTGTTLWTKGNATINAFYMRQGKKLDVMVRIVLGSTTVWGASGNQSFTLPFAVNNSAFGSTQTMMHGNFYTLNSGLSTGFGFCTTDPTYNQRTRLIYTQYSSTTYTPNWVSNTAPHITNVNDELCINATFILT